MIFVKPRDAALVLGDQLRIKASLAVARNRQLDRAGGGHDRLLAIPISPIARLCAGEMMIRLSVENPFRQGLLQIVKPPIGVENRLRIGASGARSAIPVSISRSASTSASIQTLDRGFSGKNHERPAALISDADHKFLA